LAGIGDSPYFLLVLLVSAFSMPLVFAAWIRNTARHGKEPWRFVLKAFAWGAVFSVIIALISNLVLTVTLGQIGPLTDFLARRFTDPLFVIAVVIAAPIGEEAAKGLGVRAGRPEIQRLIDGLVYGAAAGLGFSATENLLYGVLALFRPDGGATASLVVIAVRSFSSSFLHASASAAVGYGLAKSWLTGRARAILPFYVMAVIMHATFNLLAILADLYEELYGRVIAFGAAVLMAIVAITIVRSKLATHTHAAHP
jgi:protease PrsW